jgi:uncharacterized integral membrane protein
MPPEGDTQGDRHRSGWAPVPDPTVLTTEALQREIGALKDLMEQRIIGLRELVESQIAATVSVREGQLDSILGRIDLVETQRVEQKADTKAAVDAALTAQKEAVKEQTTASERAIAKSEAATTKSIEQLASTFQTAFDGQRRDIDDLKERVGTYEARRGGAEGQRASTQMWQIWVAGAVVTVLIALVIIVANVLTGV